MAWREIGWRVTTGAGITPIVGAFACHFFEFWLRPLRIPRAEIERRADEIAARHPDDPERAAFVEEHAAWFRSDDFEEALWRRVRRRIAKRTAPARW